jgi:hypothetical protein
MEWITTVASYGATFILGTIAGVYGTAQGTYLATVWTAERQEKNYRKKIIDSFQECEKQMPDLFEEIRADLKKNPLITKFTLLPNDTGCIDGMTFVYH